MTYLEEELPLVCLITFLFLLLSIPLVFNSHQHKEPSCVCDFDDKEGKKNYKVITKKRRRSASTRSYKKKSSAHKLLKKKSRKTVKEDDDDESSISTSSSSSSNKVLKKMPMKPVAPTRPMRIRDDDEAETKVVEVGAVEVEDEQQVKVKLELEPVEGDGKTETKVDFKLDVEVDPNTPGKEPLTTHLEGQVAHNVPLMDLLIDSTQVEGNEMDVEMEGKTKDDGNVVLEGSVQQGKDQVEKH